MRLLCFRSFGHADTVAGSWCSLCIWTCWHDTIANLADNTRFVRVFKRRRKADTVEPHANTALKEVRLAFGPVEARNTGRCRFGHQSLIELGSFNAFWRIRLDIAIGINRLLAITKQEVGIDRRIGIFHAACNETIGSGCRISQRFSGCDQLFKGLREFKTLLREEVFVPIDDPVINGEWQRAEATIGILGKR